METSPRERHFIAVSIVAALVPAWETERCGDGQGSVSNMNSQKSAQSSDIDPLLQELLELMRQRLLLMHDVARAKWNMKKPLADTGREQSMLRALAEKGRALGMESEFTSVFFAAQIEASRLLQMEDLRRWKTERRGPFVDAPGLTQDVRPRIDKLNEKLVAALANARPVLRGRETHFRRLAANTLKGEGITAEIRDKAIRPLTGGSESGATKRAASRNNASRDKASNEP
jgi:chorismate mutase-like protein